MGARIVLSKAEFAARILDNPYIPIDPTLKQAEFLLHDEREVFYGGAARGGKSWALLMAALMYVEEPGYRALILRRSYADLSLPNSLIPISHEWLQGKAEWNGQAHTWTFPSGSVLAFGYLQDEGDEYRYKSSDYSFIGFDELTQFSESQYTYLFSRLTKSSDSSIPTRMRSASNPGDRGHDWVKARFIMPSPEQLAGEHRAFIPAKLTDNPHIDQEDYNANLDKLDPVRAAQLRYGDWNVRAAGNMFKRESLPPFLSAEDVPAGLRTLRYWDRAATAPKPGRDPDYTVGFKLGEKAGRYYALDVQRFRLPPMETETRILQTAQSDGVGTAIRQEEEGGSSGKDAIDHYARVVLKGFAFQGMRSTGDKATRATPASAAWAQGNVFVVLAPWTEALLAELEAFPEGAHDDQADAFSGAFNALTNVWKAPEEFLPVNYERLFGGG